MSILLEALRKSEKSQHPREAPDIHAGDQSNPGSNSIRMGPLALLLVLALLVSGWCVWHQYQAPAGSYQPPVTLAPGEVRTVGSPVTKQGDAGGQESQDSQPDTLTDSSGGKPRTPVESFQQATRSITKSKPANQGKPKPKTSPDRKPATKVAVARKNQSAKASIGGDRPVVAADKKRRPQQPAPISYWELPDAIRASVPEIKFSVLVYAKEPADRFVLINGQRLAEGDSPLPGLVVKEIRRDGVIFSYRLYQFLVER
jgi:general secretion pathway protein B